MASDRRPVSATRPLRLSQRLKLILDSTEADRLSFTDLAAQLQGRAWGGLLFIFAAINVLPLPPGTSVFFAMPMLIVSAQMILGRTSPWFPAPLNRRGVKRTELEKLIGKFAWVEDRIDRILKPRIANLTGPRATQAIGLFSFLLALVAAVPIPLFHVAPAAAVVLFGLALIYRDGALVILATIAGLLALAFDALLIGSGVALLAYLLGLIHR